MMEYFKARPTGPSSTHCARAYLKCHSTQLALKGISTTEYYVFNTTRHRNKDVLTQAQVPITPVICIPYKI